MILPTPVVLWTVACASNTCGSFNPISSSGVSASTTYTAPTTVPGGDGTVTITATSITDPTKSVSGKVTIQSTSPPGAEISVSVLPASFYTQTIGATRNTKLTATVVGDTLNKGVDWKLSCTLSSCGTITSHTASGVASTYSAPTSAVAPSGGTVTITASSTTDPTKSVVVTANVVTAAPIVVTMSTPPPATLAAGSVTTLAASVSSGTLGVDWTVTCGGGCVRELQSLARAYDQRRQDHLHRSRLCPRRRHGNDYGRFLGDNARKLRHQSGRRSSRLLRSPSRRLRPCWWMLQPRLRRRWRTTPATLG